MAFVVRRRKALIDYKRNIIANTQNSVNAEAMEIGDALIPGLTTHAGAVLGGMNTTGDLLGICASVIQLQHVTELQAVTTTSTNETAGSAAYYVDWEPIDNLVEIEADLSAVAGTTANSTLIGNFALSTTDSGLLNEASYVAYLTKSNVQFTSYGAVPTANLKVRGRFISGSYQ